MKFSDMMGEGDNATATVVDTDTDTVPPAVRTDDPAPEAPIRFGKSRTDAETVPPTGSEPITIPVTAAAPAPVKAPAPAAAPVMSEPSIKELISELVPQRPGTSVTSDTGTLDPTAWLDGLPSIVDDLLPS